MLNIKHCSATKTVGYIVPNRTRPLNIGTTMCSRGHIYAYAFPYYINAEIWPLLKFVFCSAFWCYQMCLCTSFRCESVWCIRNAAGVQQCGWGRETRADLVEMQEVVAPRPTAMLRKVANTKLRSANQILFYCAPKSWPESWPSLSAAHRNF